MALDDDNDTYQVFIRGYHLKYESMGRPYHVYTIELLGSINGTKYHVEKRYSEFSSLHHALKKNCQTAEFPPKRVRNSNLKVLEQRKLALEMYIQTMLNLTNTKQQVLNFLGVHDETQKICNKKISETHNIVSSNSSSHPVLTFHCDPYVNANERRSLPDIVTNGVLLGIYKS